MQALMNLLKVIFAPLWWLLRTLRWLWITLLLIGVPLFIYVAFIAKEPVFTVENGEVMILNDQCEVQNDPDKEGREML